MGGRTIWRISQTNDFIVEFWQALNYIRYTLRNPGAADRLERKTYAEIEHYRHMSLRSYQPVGTSDDGQPVYRLFVKNYIIYYTLEDDTMVLSHFLYNRRDTGNIL
jgi:hypothetical protein